MRLGTDRHLKEIYRRFSGSIKPTHRAYIKSIHALVNLAEAKDPYTKKHSVKVSNYAVSLAGYIGLSEKDTEIIQLAAILHDIGKLGVREKVLLKPGPLNKKEFEEVKRHPAMGVEIIKPLKFFSEIVSMVEHHHENYDGTGYPAGLKGERIPFGARLLAIADVYDALTSKRAYREAYPPAKALEIMKRDSGRKFDPDLLEAFMNCLPSKKKR